MTSNQSTGRKLLEIFGLLALVVLIAWLAISLVRIMPGAVASLASLADSVYHPSQESQTLTVSTPSNIVNDGETFVVAWDELTTDGRYHFSYECNDDGVALAVEQMNGDIVNLNCGEPYYITDDSSIVLSANSSKTRFVDITYSITFTPDNASFDPFVTTKRLTVVNPAISTSADAEDSESDSETEASQEEAATPQATTTPSQTTTQTQVIYQIPVSDPNGVIDLQVSHVAVGELSNETFIRRGDIETDMQGAFQFAVKNIGTKTATNWSYEATLPNGSTYESGSQTALRPNEEAIITLGFTSFGETGIKNIGAEVDATGDNNSRNDRYQWAMKIVN